MKITLIEEPTFSAKAGDVVITGLRVTSEWKGFKELTSAKGQTLIVVSDGNGGFGMGSIFENTFSGKPKTMEAILVKGSPDLVARLAEGADKPQPTSEAAPRAAAATDTAKAGATP